MCLVEFFHTKVMFSIDLFSIFVTIMFNSTSETVTDYVTVSKYHTLSCHIKSHINDNPIFS